jgi:hypothetical protein
MTDLSPAIRPAAPLATTNPYGGVFGAQLMAAIRQLVANPMGLAV